MSDRELLELAAKAADIFLTPETLARAFPKWKWDKDFEPRHEGELGMSGAVLVYDYDGKLSGTTREAWNPITDDGDALRLMVKLDLSSLVIFPSAGGKRREFWTPNSGHDNGNAATTEAEYAADPLAATRRAIVRAAAEIGRQMP